MAEIEKSLRKALEQKVANLDQGSSTTAKDSTSGTASEKNDKVTAAMDKLTHDKQGAADSQKGGISDQSKSNSDQNVEGAKSEKEHKISSIKKLFAAAKGSLGSPDPQSCASDLKK